MKFEVFWGDFNQFLLKILKKLRIYCQNINFLLKNQICLKNSIIEFFLKIIESKFEKNLHFIPKNTKKNSNAKKKLISTKISSFLIKKHLKPPQ